MERAQHWSVAHLSPQHWGKYNTVSPCQRCQTGGPQWFVDCPTLQCTHDGSFWWNLSSIMAQTKLWKVLVCPWNYVVRGGEKLAGSLTKWLHGCCQIGVLIWEFFCPWQCDPDAIEDTPHFDWCSREIFSVVWVAHLPHCVGVVAGSAPLFNGMVKWVFGAILMNVGGGIGDCELCKSWCNVGKNDCVLDGGIIPVLEYVCKAAGLPIMEGITKHNMKQLLHETCAINDAGYVSHSHQPPYSHSQCIKWW